MFYRLLTMNKVVYSTNPLNYKRLNRVNLPRRSEVRQRQNKQHCSHNNSQ